MSSDRTTFEKAVSSLDQRYYLFGHAAEVSGWVEARLDYLSDPIEIQEWPDGSFIRVYTLPSDAPCPTVPFEGYQYADVLVCMKLPDGEMVWNAGEKKRAAVTIAGIKFLPPREEALRYQPQLAAYRGKMNQGQAALLFILLEPSEGITWAKHDARHDMDVIYRVERTDEGLVMEARSVSPAGIPLSAQQVSSDELLTMIGDDEVYVWITAPVANRLAGI